MYTAFEVVPILNTPFLSSHVRTPIQTLKRKRKMSNPRFQNPNSGNCRMAKIGDTTTMKTMMRLKMKSWTMKRTTTKKAIIRHRSLLCRRLLDARWDLSLLHSSSNSQEATTCLETTANLLLHLSGLLQDLRRLQLQDLVLHQHVSRLEAGKRDVFLSSNRGASRTS